MKRLITSAEQVREYSDIYNNAYKIYKESFGCISDAWNYVKGEILAGNIPELEGRMLVKDVTREYLNSDKKSTNFRDLI